MIEVAAALIAREDGALLVCRRGRGGVCARRWEFPGGKREANETAENCVARECREELGVELSVGEPFADFTHAYPDREIRFVFFRASIVSGEPKRRVHSRIRWAQGRSLPALPFCPADARVIRMLAGGCRA